MTESETFKSAPLDIELPVTETILLEQKEHALFVTLNRPNSRNAMSLLMVHELVSVFNAIKHSTTVRAVVLRGANGHFCAGGDIKDMAGARAAVGNANNNNPESDPFYTLNKAFGHMLMLANEIPQVLIVVTEGAVLGGGFGLVCISDIALTLGSAKFGLPETGLGIPPAQIAPFVVSRIGLTQARRLALLGVRFDGYEAKQLGIVHEVHDNHQALETAIETVLKDVKRCAPHANKITKALMLSVGKEPLDQLLDGAAKSFSAAVQGAEGQEGTMAFIQKRAPNWSAE